MDRGGVLQDRYEVVRQLGRGGAGELLLVRDLKRGGEHRALKILRPRTADPGLTPLFKSEFLLLSEVRHECIVAVRDFAVLDSGQPYFTMDYVPGENCRSFVQADRLDGHEYVELAAGLLGALAHIHARGIVHRDIKPENIVMRRGDGHLSPCLVDFGLAVLSAAARPGEATGTLPYIAPEVLAGGAAGMASDLFAVGMVLFEVSVGKAPEDGRRLLAEPHRCLAPDRIRRLMTRQGRETIPERFGDFVSRLTTATPATRFASAAAALQALREMYGEEFVGAPVDVAVRPLIAEVPLVGRGPALGRLMMRVEALQDGALLDPITVVAGAEGSGVTRLLATLRNHASVSGCLVCSGASLAELAADVVTHPLVEAETPAASAGADELIFRIDAALHALPQTESPVLILDDIHRLDEGACGALRRWITALEGREGRSRLLLVLGGRNEGDSPGADLLKTAGRAVPVELRDLAPLRGSDIRGALSIVLGGSGVPTEAVQLLERASGGSPRLFHELLRLLVDEAVLDFEADQPVLRADKLKRMRLPDGVVSAVRRRAKRLAQASRDALARFALIDHGLDFAAAESLAAGRLPALLGGRFLVRDRGRIGFADEITRQAADTLEGAKRERALRETAQALTDRDAFTAALLFSQAGDLEEARAVGIPAAQALASDGHLEPARRLLDTLADGAPEGEIGRLLLRVLYRTGRVESAGSLGKKLLRQEFDVETLFATVSALREASLPEAALRLLGKYSGRAEGEAAVRLINAQASLLNTMRRFDEAMEASRRAEQALGCLIDKRGAVARTRANILRWSGRRAQAMRTESEIIAAGDQVGVTPRLSALVNRSQFHRLDGRVLAAIRDARLAVREARQSGRQVLRARALVVLGAVMIDCGRPAKALKHFERSRAIFERAARVGDVVYALEQEALALALNGRPAESEIRAARAAALPAVSSLDSTADVHGYASAVSSFLSGDAKEATAACRSILRDEGVNHAETAALAADIVTAGGDPDAAEEAWRVAARHAWLERRRDIAAQVRIGKARCCALRGAWRLAEVTLDRGRGDLFDLKTPLRARSLMLRAASSIHKDEPAAAGRQIEEAVAIANRTDVAPLVGEAYEVAASLLEEGAMQRYLRSPTSAASAALLEASREAWGLYGNEKMLRKIDLHLSELPRMASDPLGGPDADRLVKVLHIAREMNQQFERDRLLQLILDRAIELTSAERGFVILLREGRQEVHIARNIDRESLSEPEQKVSSQIISEVIRSGRIVRSENAESDERFEEFLSVRQLHLKSIITVPFRSGGKTIGALYLDNRFRTGNFGENEERLLSLFADHAVTAIDKQELIDELGAKQRELEERDRQQKAELRRQGKELKHAKREIRQHRRARGYTFDRIVARSVAMQAVMREARRVSDSDLPVLLTGENGTGKETLAMAMHYESRRQSMQCLALNCAAYPEGLLEAELFGHVRGSFSGADRDRPGIFEEADGGTLYLDEVGEMSAPMQVRLLQSLESGEVRRVGESTPRAVDVRLITATNQDLDELVRNGKFREDLYYRISGFVLRVPPLRERLEDVEPLAYAFVEESARREGRPHLKISNEAIARLESYAWSGNVRELRNVILRAVVTAKDDVITPEDVAFEARSPTILPGFDPTHADRVVSELVNRGMDLNSRQQSALARLLNRGKLAFGEYQKLFRISKSTTARDLDGLLDLDVLEKRGKTRAVVYLPGPKLREVAKKLGRA